MFLKGVAIAAGLALFALAVSTYNIGIIIGVIGVLVVLFLIAEKQWP